MELPFSRNGALGDQKGPKMDDDVGSTVPSATILFAISSTRLHTLAAVILKQEGDGKESENKSNGTYDSRPKTSDTL